MHFCIIARYKVFGFPFFMISLSLSFRRNNTRNRTNAMHATVRIINTTRSRAFVGEDYRDESGCSSLV